MRIVILILAWITPAVIAEILGWKGIWGSGSAFFDSLIPIPVAGGVFHVPGFANVEHSAVYFTTSMQAIKWRNLDLVTEQSTMATICLYEEDKSTTLHKGYVDCFSSRDTIEENSRK